MRFRWSELDTSGLVGHRSRHAMTYDVALASVILFGGSNKFSITLNDLFRLVGSTWEPVAVTGDKPLSVDRGALVCDVGRGFSVHLGGQHNSGRGWPNQNATWILENGRWRKWRGWFQSQPGPRCAHSMAYDQSMGVIVLFGGASSIAHSLGDTWTFDGSNWRRIQGPGPGPRRYAQFSWDSNLGGCVLYGGSVDDYGERPLNDCWLFKDGAWYFLPWASGGFFRDDCGACFHMGAGRLVLLSGKESESEMLTLEPSGWQPAECENWLPARQCYGYAYDPHRDAIVVHGGEEGHDARRFGDTHLLTMC